MAEMFSSPELLDKGPLNTEPVKSEGSAESPENVKWSRAWGNLFGVNPVQVFFPDHELNARVYTLDGDSGYQVEEKTVFGGKEEPDEISVLDYASHLNFPRKSRRGETHGRARLKKADVLAIRAWAKTFLAIHNVPPWTSKSSELGISEGTLRDIVHRRTWMHI